MGHRLATELISQVVQHLDLPDLYTCTLVNHSFFIATNLWLWRTLTISKRNTAQNILWTLLTNRHHVGQYIQHLAFYDFYWDDDDLSCVMTHANHVEQLTVGSGRYGNRISDTMLQQLPSHCPHLVSLRLLRMRSSAITPSTMVALGQHCHHLTELSLSLDADDTLVNHHPSGLLSALAHCPLKKLSLCHFILSDDDDINNTTILLDLTAFSGLTYLKLLSGDTPGHNNLVTGTRCITTALRSRPGITCWPHLQEIYLNHCHGLNDTLAIDFIKTHPRLEAIQLCYSYTPTRYGYYHPLRSLDNNNNDGITDTTLEAMATFLPNLDMLDLTGQCQITHVGVRRLLLDGARQLAHLNITWCRIARANFPQADLICLDYECGEYDENGSPVYLYCLTDDVMKRIRHDKGSDSDNDDDNDDDDHDNDHDHDDDDET